MTDIAKLFDFKSIPEVFKPVTGGYVYRAPNAWLFGSRSRYLVNEAQREEIQTIFKMPTQRMVLVASVSWIVISALLAEAAALWLWVGYHNLVLTGLSAIVLFPFLLYVGGLIHRQLLLRRLRPVLARLPATDLQITDLEENQAIAIATSAASISPAVRRGLKICCIVGMLLWFGALTLRSIEMYDVHHSMVVAFLAANSDLSGLLNLFIVVGLVFGFAVGCAYEGPPKVGFGSSPRE